MCEAILAEEPSFELFSGRGEAVIVTRQAEWHFTASPWPFDVPQLNGSLEANLVPVASYKNTSDLLASAVREQITWRVHQS